MKKKVGDDNTKPYSELFENETAQIQKTNALKLLAGRIAHDFNNILGAIEGYASMIADTISPKNPIFEDVSEIRKAVTSATNITKQLLTFSGKTAPITEVANLNEIITDLLRLPNKFTDKNIKLNLDLCENLPNSEINTSTIKQALLNFVTNAMEAIKNANKSDGIIKIKTMRVKPLDLAKQQMIMISVSDNGCGIETKNINHILDPFFTTKPRGRGTGLGLSTAYSIIQQHNGHLEISSQLEKGSSFDIYLPATNKPAPDKPKQIIQPASKNKKITKRILFIEDDDSLRTATCRALNLHGFTIFPCSTKKEAKKVFDETNGDFDIMFSDIILPDGNGIQIADELSALNPKIRIIITSGHLKKATEIENIIKGKYEFVPKPYKIANLLNIFNTRQEFK